MADMLERKRGHTMLFHLPLGLPPHLSLPPAFPACASSPSSNAGVSLIFTTLYLD